MTTSERANKLTNNVWFTRKAWINAEDRLLKNDFQTQLLMVVYAAYTSCLSVIMLKYDPRPADKNFIDTSLAVLSIVLLALSLYLNTKSFKDRAARFKSGYHDLQRIEDRLRLLTEKAESPEAEQDYNALLDHYNKALRDVENHSDLDDIRARILAGTGLTSRLLTWQERGRYYWWRLWRFTSLFIAYAAPVAAVLWYIVK
ncbi:SLATT domain-containing protein [Pseudoduganella aquatica]|uniref:SLATT domain-containing protein n=1 Tax=Pseudoduganella aquatica TaxID=2660641 RepID=A0A7X4KME8_9BURK|nr:SLATT domain-containing protein [Pseudoduganella aquatica]MYN08053.1 SLATT domain-containing protein [Pseudoduganella aquatica]